jgi:hypothetical protein
MRRPAHFRTGFDGPNDFSRPPAEINFKETKMNNETEELLSEQDLSDGKLVEQDPLEAIEDPPVRQAGYNLIPDFGDDTKGTIQESGEIFPKD